MKPIFWLLLAITVPALAGAQEIVIEGIVYNRTKILESVADSPPKPENVGVAGVQVMLLGLGGQDRSMGHPVAMSDDMGRAKFVLNLPGETLTKPIQAMAMYEGVRFDFVIPPGGKFEAPIYETTTESEAIRIIRDEIILEVRGDPPDHVRVTERIQVANSGSRTFQGHKAKAAMPHGILFTVGVPAPLHARPEAFFAGGSTLDVRMRDEKVMAVVGNLNPTGPDGEAVFITYSLHMGEEGGGALSRPLYTEADLFRVYHAKKGIKVSLPDGFSEPVQAEGKGLEDFFMMEKAGISAGTEMVLGLSLRSQRFYWVLASFAGAFVLALILALVGAIGGPGAVRATSAHASEIDRIIDEIDALDPAAEGRRVAHLERILEILRQGRKPPDA